MNTGKKEMTKVFKNTPEEPFVVNPVSCKKQSRDIILSATSPTEEATLKNDLRASGQSKLKSAAVVNI